MGLQRFLADLRAPVVALALVALAAQQLVGVALAASPTLAAASGLSFCLSGDPQDTGDAGDIPPMPSHLCLCSLHGGLGLAAGDASPLMLPQPVSGPLLLPQAAFSVSLRLSILPPARAPPHPSLA